MIEVKCYLASGVPSSDHLVSIAVIYSVRGAEIASYLVTDEKCLQFYCYIKKMCKHFWLQMSKWYRNDCPCLRPYCVLLVFFRWMLTDQHLVAAFKVVSLKFKHIPIFVTSNYNWTLTVQHSLYWRKFTISRRLQLYFPANLVICCTLSDENGTGAG
jgi:hypothetical protein